MPVLTKICGLSTPETVDAAVGGGAAWLGFVFFPNSPRNVEADAATALVRRLPGHVRAAAVLVDPDEALIRRVTATGVHALQLHGNEPPERLAALRSPGLELWKAVPVRTRADLEQARLYRGVADRIVYDAKTPVGSLPGGMGLRFDWALLDGFDHPLPWALSGGLDDGNIAQAVGRTGARMVDVSSGVESAPGVKDMDKIATFLQSAAQL
ncbi:phosphoribosylanthranilate isomerase [uncultured Sphingomonas sp.]|uniref:phosphoribosylanthranilate isomerase n=1 Tax=uncultured Sphingomonas sp. TaxID=158754 RepID=UPI0025E13A2B|nr:phosphoribosylanthranilate isomerase [uncultured Sphingomonas sp.]